MRALSPTRPGSLPGVPPVDVAAAVETCPAAGIEARIALERAHRAFDRVERRATVRQHTPAGQRGVPHALTEVARFGRIRAGPAVNDDGGHAGRRGAVGG